VENKRVDAGHRRLFGAIVYTRNGGTNGWATRRSWKIPGVVGLYHVGTGKDTQREGWHWRFTKLSFRKTHRHQLVITLTTPQHHL